MYELEMVEGQGMQSGIGTIDEIGIVDSVYRESGIRVDPGDRIESSSTADDHVDIIELVTNGGMRLCDDDSIHIAELNAGITILAAQAGQVDIAGGGVGAVIECIAACPAINGTSDRCRVTKGEAIRRRPADEALDIAACVGAVASVGDPIGIVIRDHNLRIARTIETEVEIESTASTDGYSGKVETIIALALLFENVVIAPAIAEEVGVVTLSPIIVSSPALPVMPLSPVSPIRMSWLLPPMMLSKSIKRPSAPAEM